MRVILMAAVLAMAGCPGGGESAGPDGSEAPLLCAPAVGPGDEPTGDGTPPLGDFAVTVACVSGCANPAPPVALLADRVSIESAGPDRIDAVVTLIRNGQVIDAFSVSRDRGCWVNSASTDGCRSTFHICDGGGRPFSTRITVRTAMTSGVTAPDVVMEIR